MEPIKISDTYTGIDRLIAEKCDDGNGILEEEKGEISIFTKAQQEFQASGEKQEVTIKGIKYYYNIVVNELLKRAGQQNTPSIPNSKPTPENSDYNLTKQKWAENWWDNSGENLQVKKNLDKYLPFFEEASKETGIPVSILVGICCKESTMGTRSGNVMQLNPRTAKNNDCNNVYNKKTNIMAAAKYLAHLLKKSNGNMKQALIGYNRGEASDLYKKCIDYKYYADKVLSLSEEYNKRT